MVTREFKVTYMTSICGSHRISTGQCQTRHRAPHGLQRLMAALTALSCWSSNLWRIHSSLRKRMNGKKPFFCCIVETELANLGVFSSNPWVQRLQISISGKTSNLSKNTLYSLGGIFFFFFLIIIIWLEREKTDILVCGIKLFWRQYLKRSLRNTQS